MDHRITISKMWFAMGIVRLTKSSRTAYKGNDDKREQLHTSFRWLSTRRFIPS